MTEPEKEFHLPIDELASHAPGLLRGEAKKLLAKLDQADINHDGKRDIVQLYKVAMVLISVGAKVNDAIDFDALAVWLCALPFVKNKAAMVEIVKELCHLVESAGK